MSHAQAAAAADSAPQVPPARGVYVVTGPTVPPGCVRVLVYDGERCLSRSDVPADIWHEATDRAAWQHWLEMKAPAVRAIVAA